MNCIALNYSIFNCMRPAPRTTAIFCRQHLSFIVICNTRQLCSNFSENLARIGQNRSIFKKSGCFGIKERHGPSRTVTDRHGPSQTVTDHYGSIVICTKHHSIVYCQLIAIFLRNSYTIGLFEAILGPSRTVTDSHGPSLTVTDRHRPLQTVIELTDRTYCT